MTIGDGFNSADRIGNLPGNELFGQTTRGGLTAKVYLQECRGLAENDQPGWYHVGIDLETADGSIVESIPVSQDSDEDHHGHYQIDAAKAAATQALVDYEQAYDKAVASATAAGDTVSNEAWINGFAELRVAREASSRLTSMLMAMMLGDDEDDEVGSMGAGGGLGMLMALAAQSDPELDAKLNALLGDFDPDAEIPNANEGYED